MHGHLSIQEDIYVFLETEREILNPVSVGRKSIGSEGSKYFNWWMYIVKTWQVLQESKEDFNPFNAELNPICHLLALLGGATIVVVSRLRVNENM